MQKFKSFLDRYFKITEKGSKISVEIIAGVTTFLAMAYILFVNAGILGDAGMDFNGVFMATAISAAFATILMGVYAKYPVALAPGMGVNALFAYTVVLAGGYSWQAALSSVLISGLIFILISVTDLRKKVINAIPNSLKKAVGAAIGLFIAFIGLKNAEIIVANPSTFVSLNPELLTTPTVVLAIVGLLLTIVLIALKLNNAVFLGMVGTAVIGLIAGFCGVEGMPSLPTSWSISFDGLALIAGQAFKGFGELISHKGILSAVVIVLSFLFVDFFDTAGTLISVGGEAGLIDENGELVDAEKALLVDAVGTVAGAALGTSTVTSFVESTAGIAVGGRTGLTAVVTGILFILSIFLSPLLSIVTNAVTAPALIAVGILMVKNLKEVDWDDFAIAASAFTVLIFTVLAYSITDGLAMGFIVYAVAMLASKRAKEVNPIMWVLPFLFVLYFLIR